ncbi:MAG: DUF1540 domain-containing protein [Sedimentisphaeraceae bacterium JB056]
MQMPDIRSCDVEECAYNKKHQCHALAITVGDQKGAMCDTFWSEKESQCDGGDPSQSGHVGACHMSNCRHNDRLECSASCISVGHKQDHADCLTYAR